MQVLCQVTVQGKGYLHPDGKVAVSRIRLEDLLEYLPTGPAERVVSVNYDTAEQRSSRNSRLVAGERSSVGRIPAMQLVPELRAAAWDVEEY